MPPGTTVQRFSLATGGTRGDEIKTTPDGREGWAEYFLRHGYPVYVVDQVARGRSPYNAAAAGPLEKPVQDRFDLERLHPRPQGQQARPNPRQMGRRPAGCWFLRKRAEVAPPVSQEFHLVLEPVGEF